MPTFPIPSSDSCVQSVAAAENQHQDLARLHGKGVSIKRAQRLARKRIPEAQLPILGGSHQSLSIGRILAVVHGSIVRSKGEATAFPGHIPDSHPASLATGGLCWLLGSSASKSWGKRQFNLSWSSTGKPGSRKPTIAFWNG